MRVQCTPVGVFARAALASAVGVSGAALGGALEAPPASAALVCTVGVDNPRWLTNPWLYTVGGVNCAAEFLQVNNWLDLRWYNGAGTWLTRAYASDVSNFAYEFHTVVDAVCYGGDWKAYESATVVDLTGGAGSQSVYSGTVTFWC